MKVIEFENTQGITLRYTAATVFERIVSYLIDLVILFFICLIIMLMFGMGRNSELILGLVIAPIFIFYSLIMEMVNDGQSIGKMILGLKIVRVDGRYPSGYDYLMRWLFRWLDLYATSGMLAMMAVSASPRSQRIGDMLADTTVIKTKNLRVSLHRIVGNSKLDNYEPLYPQVVQFSEDQILMAKTVLDRAKKYDNAAHQEALSDLAIRLANLMDIKKPGNNQAFIKTIIKDFVLLTR